MTSRLADVNTGGVVLIPIKQKRPFGSGTSKGFTIWYRTSSSSDIVEPPEVGAKWGELYLHRNTTAQRWQRWLFGTSGAWHLVQLGNEAKVLHLVILDRMLPLCSNGEPSWVTVSSYQTMRARREKSAVPQ